MGVHTDDRVIKNIIFDRGLRKYVRVTAIMVFDQVYISNHNCYWPRFRVERMRVTIPDLANTSNF